MGLVRMCVFVGDLCIALRISPTVTNRPSHFKSHMTTTSYTASVLTITGYTHILDQNGKETQLRTVICACISVCSLRKVDTGGKEVTVVMTMHSNNKFKCKSDCFFHLKTFLVSVHVRVCMCERMCSHCGVKRGNVLIEQTQPWVTCEHVMMSIILLQSNH